MRLDRVGTDDRWRKPRVGDCHLCGVRVIEHPAWAHRVRALWAWLLSH